MQGRLRLSYNVHGDTGLGCRSLLVAALSCRGYSGLVPVLNFKSVHPEPDVAYSEVHNAGSMMNDGV